MREILFRAKSIHNDEWVQGELVHQTDFYGDKVNRWFIINGIATRDYDIRYEIEVKPETVGQYIGLTDKNGTKIFEGDILNVEYSDEKGDSCSRQCIIKSITDWKTLGELDFSHEIEVIGNIHDNCGQRLDWEDDK